MSIIIDDKRVMVEVPCDSFQVNLPPLRIELSWSEQHKTVWVGLKDNEKHSRGMQVPYGELFDCLDALLEKKFKGKK